MRLLVDSASLWYRAFYGMPESISSTTGLPNNAIKGFFDGLARIITRYRPDEIGICLDDNWRPQWRVDLFPGYKLNRLEADDSAEDAEGGEAEPDLLTPQIGPIIELCTLLGLHPISVEDQEADDVIATLANVSTDTSIRVMTGDRDLFQLIRLPSDVQIIYLAKGISQHDLVDGKYITTRYGIPADRYGLFASIRGDASDGLPGIKGIGEKGAASIANSFESMDAVIEAAIAESDLLSSTHRKRILADLDYARIAEKLVNCRTD
ncbi:MAG: flap endonuclease, partial [Actinobacteria bacterium]|nr:flap endonuclease [Actinomycetota bacterium]